MIRFNSLITEFDLPNPDQLKNWLRMVMRYENHREGDVTYIFCDDDFLLNTNRVFLDHDTLTDIITFPTSSNENIISGEIYISIPRVQENAKLHKKSFYNELSRVLVHGVLHLVGYNDKTGLEKTEMRAKEDYYLNLQL